MTEKIKVYVAFLYKRAEPFYALSMDEARQFVDDHGKTHSRDVRFEEDEMTQEEFDNLPKWGE